MLILFKNGISKAYVIYDKTEKPLSTEQIKSIPQLSEVYGLKLEYACLNYTSEYTHSAYQLGNSYKSEGSITIYNPDYRLTKLVGLQVARITQDTKGLSNAINRLKLEREFSEAEVADVLKNDEYSEFRYALVEIIIVGFCVTESQYVVKKGIGHIMNVEPSSEDRKSVNVTLHVVNFEDIVFDIDVAPETSTNTPLKITIQSFIDSSYVNKPKRKPRLVWEAGDGFRPKKGKMYYPSPFLNIIDQMCLDNALTYTFDASLKVLKIVSVTDSISKTETTNGEAIPETAFLYGGSFSTARASGKNSRNFVVGYTVSNQFKIISPITRTNFSNLTFKTTLYSYEVFDSILLLIRPTDYGFPRDKDSNGNILIDQANILRNRDPTDSVKSYNEWQGFATETKNGNLFIKLQVLEVTHHIGYDDQYTQLICGNVFLNNFINWSQILGSLSLAQSYLTKEKARKDIEETP